MSNQLQQTVPQNTRNLLRDALTRWKAVITEVTKTLYLITPNTTLQPEKLLTGIMGITTVENTAILSDMEQHDLNEACKCILMDCPTAAEFIALRAAESLLRRWYERKTGKKITKCDSPGTLTPL